MSKWLPLVFCSLFVLNACGGDSTSSSNGAKQEDSDKDTIVNSQDNCPNTPNKDQLDSDGDDIGDACETELSDKQKALKVITEYANTKGKSSTPTVQNYTNAGVLGVSLNNLTTVNNKILSLPKDGVDTTEKIQSILKDLNIEIPKSDFDEDGVEDSVDNCPNHVNPDQKDKDGDGFGDVCDLDNDADGLPDTTDNCPAVSNPNQTDTDKDGTGDACDATDDRDDDGDGVSNSIDNCPAIANPDQSDVDENGKGDACDVTDLGDDDRDGVVNAIDNCPLVANPDQVDSDNDGKGDVCDAVDGTDTDGDGVPDSKDEFPNDATKAASVSSAYRLLTQATFGATEKEIDRIVKIGVDAWIEEELNKTSAYDSSSDAYRTHLERTIEIARYVEPSIAWTNDGIFNTSPAPIWRVLHYQMSAWWENALGHPTNIRHGSDQLRQRIAYALSQILVASAKDPRLSLRGETLAYYNDILAKNAFGNFRTLLGEVSRSAPMGVYLTYQGNKKADPDKSTRPDENFARELIQLFSIGLFELNIDGSPNRDANASTYPDAGDLRIPTYTQDDVVELAKVMTGWDVKSNSRFGYTSMGRAEYAAQMVFHPDYHEDELAEGGDGQVTIFGKTIALNGGVDKSGLDPALDVIFGHSNVGPFISKSLIMNLVTSNPSSAYVERVAKVFNDNGAGKKGDLKAVVKAILTDVEARDVASQSETFGKVKEPFLVFTQLLRTFDVKPFNGWKGPADKSKGDGKKTTVNGVYAWNQPESFFGQAPLRAKSVFNFYMPDYVPSQKYFADNDLVSPESQIETDGSIISSHNVTAYYLKRYEKNRITKVDKKSLTEFASKKSYWSSYLMLINYDRELNIFEQALDGDTNGNFEKLDVDEDRGRAISALLVHLDKVMLGNAMTSEYRSKLHEFLLSASGLNSSKPDKKFSSSLLLVSDAVRFIATSPAFISQQ